ncbi:hypothetical protein K438DRAFT_2181194 [Mycena galopus ATCC 62051]|nr:hypothetical protein K438DRAFT_2181194 [Mycena galopus ATCC 62051]
MLPKPKCKAPDNESDTSPAPRRKHGRPPKNTPPAPTLQSGSKPKTKLMVKVPARPQSMPVSSTSESDVIQDTTPDDGSPLSVLTSDWNDDDTDMQDATEALLGLAKGGHSQEPVRMMRRDEEDDEEQAVESDIELEFAIPVDGAAEDFDISRGIMAPNFFQKVADIMDIYRKDLDITLFIKLSHSHPSTALSLTYTNARARGVTSVELLAPVWGLNVSIKLSKAILRRPRFDCYFKSLEGMGGREAADQPLVGLNNSDHLSSLFKKAGAAIVELAKKKSKKQFQITIVDLAKKKDVKKDKKKDKKVPKKVTMCDTHYTVVSLMPGFQNAARRRKYDSSDSEDEAGKSDKKTGADCLRELEAATRIKDTAQGAHDLITTPPEVLNLSMSTTNVPSLCRAPQQQQQPQYPPYPYPFYPPPNAPYPPYYPLPLAPAPAPAPAPTPAPALDAAPVLTPMPVLVLPSSGLRKGLDWLLDLDTGKRGEDGHHFSAFGPTLHQNDFVCLIQLCNEEADTVLKICPSMSLGVAKILLKYGKKDCANVR